MYVPPSQETFRPRFVSPGSSFASSSVHSCRIGSKEHKTDNSFTRFLLIFEMANVSAIPEILSNVQDSSGQIPPANGAGFNRSYRDRKEDHKKIKIEVFAQTIRIREFILG
ncbi:uncharacterized protein LOC111345277 [Stylophora pistillata]|uniref:uncharacterized protein LOC111345277 n=1 Tax=Stylophora pistillata TaxID=50429 RepID=UPI000C057C13|nr:uncharacterized protein LOC111345277 [Stylophora pistillata]